MRKCFQASILMMIVLFLASCDINDSDDNTPPADNGRLSVTITYNGSFGSDFDATRPGTGNSYAYLYRDMGSTAANETPIIDQGAPITSNGGSHTFGNLAHGDYYIIAFYDYNGRGPNATDDLNKKDRYALYDGTTGSPLRSDAATISVDATLKSVSITIEGDWALQESNYFLTSIP